MRKVMKGAVGFCIFWGIWFYDWSIFFGFILDILWWVSGDDLYFWMRIAMTVALALVWLFLRFQSDRVKERVRSEVP